MTNGELIKKLESLPKESKVRLMDWRKAFKHSEKHVGVYDLYSVTKQNNSVIISFENVE